MCSLFDMLLNDRQQRHGTDVFNDLRPDFTLTLYHAKHRCFTFCASTALALANTAVIRFINLYMSAHFR